MISNIKGRGISKSSLFVILISLLLISYNMLIWMFVGNISLALNQKIIILLFSVIIPSYIFILVTSYKYSGLARFYFIFTILTIFFYYGQHILVVIDYEYLLSQKHTILDNRISDQSILNASLLIIESLLIIHIGYFFGLKQKKSEIIAIEHTAKEKEKPIEKVQKTFKFIAWTLFIVSSIAMLVKLSYLIELNQMYGYLERRTLESTDEYISGLGNFALYLSEWFFPSIYMLFIFNTTKFKNKWMYFIIAGFSGLYLMSGSRFLLLKLGMGIFLIQFVWIKPLTKKSVMKIIFLALVAVFVLKTTTYLRSISYADISDITTIISGLLNDGLISGILWETGITFTSVSNILDKCPSVVPHFGGKSYLGSILLFLPSFMRFGFFDEYNLSVSAMFSPLYYNTDLIGYGSSFIAEAYYNFGYFMLLIMLLMGHLFAKLENKLHKAKITQNAPMFFLITYILSELIYIVRNDLYSIPRSIIFYAIIPLVLYKILNILFSKKIKENKMTADVIRK